MTVGRRKFEVKEGYVRYRVNLMANMSEEQYNEMETVGVTKFFNDLLERDIKSRNDISVNKDNISSDVVEKFLNDPRKPYLIQQLLTEYYYGNSNIVNTVLANHSQSVSTELATDLHVNNSETAYETKEADKDTTLKVNQTTEQVEELQGKEVEKVVEQVKVEEVQKVVKNSGEHNRIVENKVEEVKEPVEEIVEEMIEIDKKTVQSEVKKDDDKNKSKSRFGDTPLSTLMRGNASEKMLNKNK